MSVPSLFDGKASKTFKAQYDFKCSCCEGQFPQGTLAFYSPDDEIVNADPDHSVLGELMDLGETTYQDGEHAKVKIEVMPRGKTARDKCPRCFIIHTDAQGDECW